MRCGEREGVSGDDELYRKDVHRTRDCLDCVVLD